MKSPLAERPLITLPEVGSTQEHLAQCLRNGEKVGGVLAHHQTAGYGRHRRAWHSGPNQSLTVSLALVEFQNHPKPWLIGMNVALACAGAIHGQVRWPNDLILGGKKVGGILTEVIEGVPVVGIGINLSQTEFPEEIADRATSLAIASPRAVPSAEELLTLICARIELLPEPTAWSDLQPVWTNFDTTPGKKFEIEPGVQAIALGIGPEGELLCSVNGETQTVVAADAVG